MTPTTDDGEVTECVERSMSKNKSLVATGECPVCGGIVREMRNDSCHLCDGCARYFTPEEIAAGKRL